MYIHPVTLFRLAFVLVGAFGAHTAAGQSGPAQGLKVTVSSAGVGKPEQPLRALSGVGEIQNMGTLLESQSVPPELLKGPVIMVDNRAMVKLPDGLLPIIVSLSVVAAQQAELRAPQLKLRSAGGAEAPAIFWDESSRAWVCDEVSYAPGEYRDIVLFLISKEPTQGVAQVLLNGNAIGQVDLAQAATGEDKLFAEAIRGRIVKTIRLGRPVRIENGQILDVGLGISISGSAYTIIEPQKKAPAQGETEEPIRL
jgi:hypothetical protein